MQETLVIFRYNVQRMHCAFLFCIVSFHIRNSPSWVPFDWKRISLLFLLALRQPFFLSLLFRFFRTFAANSHCTRSTRSMQKDSLSCAIFFPSFPQHTALLTPYFSSLSFPLLSPLVPSCPLLFPPVPSCSDPKPIKRRGLQRPSCPYIMDMTSTYNPLRSHGA